MGEPGMVAENPPAELSPIVSSFDVGALRTQYQSSLHTAFFVIDDFLEPGFAREVAEAYPNFSAAVAQGGKEFRRVNEDVKVQLTRAEEFPQPVARLHRLLSSRIFIDRISEISGIPELVADPELKGAGMHLMGPSGNLGVHVDFNFAPEARLFRRLNILVYLTPGWQDRWGGAFEFWDERVRHRLDAFEPRFNRCVVFNTTPESFHGVTAIACPSHVTRNAFAAFYYTAEPPPEWKGEHHSTIYRARPDEWSKRFVQMPLDSARRKMGRALRFGRRLKGRLVS